MASQAEHERNRENAAATGRVIANRLRQTADAVDLFASEIENATGPTLADSAARLISVAADGPEGRFFRILLDYAREGDAAWPTPETGPGS